MEKRRTTRRMERRTSWAWRPRLRTFVAVSLFPPAIVDAEADEVEDPSEERVGADEGACALSAERICAGVTVGGGVLSGFCSAFCLDAEEEARSIAPLRTSNNDLTSPV